MALEPVSYHYKRSYAGGSERRQFGLIAEDVAERFPALAQYGPDGKPSGVYYDQLSVLLLDQVERQQRQLDRLSRMVRESR